MKYLLATFALITASVPVQAETVYLLIKSVKGNYGRGGVALHSIPMLSMDQCEEAGPLVISSERFNVPTAHNDGFECVKGK